MIRRICCAIGVLILIVCLYVLSYGPATVWVASTVSGQNFSQLNPALYDARLHTFERIYSPLYWIRERLFWSISLKPERLFLNYVRFFERPFRLADGRKVFTIMDYPPLQAGETTAHYISSSLGIGDLFVPKSGTQLFKLPQSHRILVVLALGGDEPASVALTITTTRDGPLPNEYAENLL